MREKENVLNSIGFCMRTGRKYAKKGHPPMGLYVNTCDDGREQLVVAMAFNQWNDRLMKDELHYMCVRTIDMDKILA